MEEKYKKFLEMDWTNNNKWQTYFSNLYPTPPGNKVEHFKKKFYKLHVDEDFDVNYIPSSNNGNTNTNSNYNPNYNKTNPYGTSTTGININQGNTTIYKFFTILEHLLWIISIPFCFTYLPYIRLLCIIPYCIRIIRRVGMPNLTYEFAEKIILDEHLHVLLYLALLLIDRYNVYLMLPHLMTATLNIGEYLKFVDKLPFIYKIIVNNRVLISELRANLDLLLIVFLIVGVFINLNSIFICIFFLQYLRMKYMLNVDCKYAFGRLNSYVNSFKEKLPGPIKFVITKLQAGISYIGQDNRDNNQGNQSSNTNSNAGNSGPSCTIF